MRRIVDVKCPGSGESDRNRWENLDALRPGDELKFVIADRADYDWAAGVVPLARAAREGAGVVLGRARADAGGRARALGARRPAPVRVQVQMHKILWPARDARRVMRAAVVLLSGGLDSATCLAWARREGFSAHALTVDYGQRHASKSSARAARGAQASGRGVAPHRHDRPVVPGGLRADRPTLPVPKARSARRDRLAESRRPTSRRATPCSSRARHGVGGVARRGATW